METNKKNHNNQFEINDLIDESISNAVARRNEVLDSAEILSDEETKNVTGGLSTLTTLGRFPFPPIIIGLILVDPVNY